MYDKSNRRRVTFQEIKQETNGVSNSHRYFTIVISTVTLSGHGLSWGLKVKLESMQGGIHWKSSWYGSIYKITKLSERIIVSLTLKSSHIAILFIQDLRQKVLNYDYTLTFIFILSKCTFSATQRRLSFKSCWWFMFIRKFQSRPFQWDKKEIVQD